MSYKWKATKTGASFGSGYFYLRLYNGITYFNLGGNVSVNDSSNSGDVYKRQLTALKGVTLSDLPSRVSLRNLIERCLNKTGLTLSLASQININQGSTNILDSEILSQRLTDVRGRSISCYDILMSIMVATNSTIRQRKGQWQVYNKLEHELRTPTIFFDKVERGAIRTIQPVASSVGVYQEFGGGRLHPDNYDFAQGLVNWSSINGCLLYTSRCV